MGITRRLTMPVSYACFTESQFKPLASYGELAIPLLHYNCNGQGTKKKTNGVWLNVFPYPVSCCSKH